METNNTEETTATTEETTLNVPKAVLAALDRAKSDAKKFREEKEKLFKSNFCFVLCSLSFDLYNGV